MAHPKSGDGDMAKLDGNMFVYFRPANQPEPHGHVIAARITSENPDEGFKPSAGEENRFIVFFPGSTSNITSTTSMSSAGQLLQFFEAC